MTYYELTFDRYGRTDEYDINPVDVACFGKKYITLREGECLKYSVEAKKYTGHGLEGIVSYPPISEYSRGRKDSLLFPELWMAQVIQTRTQMANRARKVIENLGLGNLSTAALQEIIRCECSEN